MIDLIIVGLFGILGSYALFTWLISYIWYTIPGNFARIDSPPIFITIIIPVRNEANNIEKLLRDLDIQTYHKNQYEVIVVNDASTDKTADIVGLLSTQLSYPIQLINLSDTPTKSPKKRAIETAIRFAKGSLIMTTDGDCRVLPNWIKSFAECHWATKAKVISGPVTFFKEQQITDYLQTVEFSSLIGSGASGIKAGYPSMCNGANFAYEKSAFVEVNGYEGVRHIASGDDEFLMHKIAKIFPDDIHFIKSADAIVYTKAHTEWSLFLRQRKRWASKWKHYQTKTPFILALYIFTCNFSLILATLSFVFGAIPINTFLILLSIKCLPEWLFIGTVLRFLQKPLAILYIPIVQLIYPWYVCFFGLLAQQPHYEWKGRELV
jgi:cellulose synthase/poly-beta-1,6-N-acetylglucosamine synthase-like glycosyltransferase